jgi:hypothetical protein
MILDFESVAGSVDRLTLDSGGGSPKVELVRPRQ